MIIPNTFTILLLIYAIYLKGCSIIAIENSIIGMSTYALPFVLVYGYISDLMKKDVLGFGDIKLVLCFGYILGYSNLIDVYNFFMFTFILASVIGGVIGIAKKNLKFYLPFSPFLILVFIYFLYFK